MPELERVYWDTCVFCYRLAPHPTYGAVLEEWTDRADRGEVEIVTSAFTLCELAKLDAPRLTEADQERKIVDFFENPFIVLQQVDRRVGEKSREIVRALNLKPADALHIASALVAGVSVLHTYDVTILKKNDQLPGLRVEQPSRHSGQAMLTLGENNDRVGA